ITRPKLRTPSRAGSDLAGTVRRLAGVTALAALLGACNTLGTPQPTQMAEPPPPPEIPATIRADELVGRWGLASYTNDKDRTRTEAAARRGCSNPYVIGAGAAG